MQLFQTYDIRFIIQKGGTSREVGEGKKKRTHDTSRTTSTAPVAHVADRELALISENRRWSLIICYFEKLPSISGTRSRLAVARSGKERGDLGRDNNDGGDGKV